MTEKNIRALLEQVRAGKVGVEAAVTRLKHMPFEDLGFAKIDHHRSLRQGMPEVILARGKHPGQVVSVVKKMMRVSPNVLITRGDAKLYRLLKKSAREAAFYSLSGAIAIHRDHTIHGRGLVLVVSAGTSDIPVAEEASVTARIMGNKVDQLYDVGVAGIHRLMNNRDVLNKARVIVCVAGMEGALPSVVAGLVAVPVIAVPTSIGYGASFQGLAALLGMLNSCASNVSVVNIDNGFGAGFVASMINRL
ncbi:MAG: nickel pincer cofactor biosynthesis protein LarB [Gammaproteobacteria bacterium]